MIETVDFLINDSLSGKRLDIAIASQNSSFSRSFLKNHCKAVLVNRQPEKFSYKCKLNDHVYAEIEKENFFNIIPEKIFLNIIYENENYIIINKPPQMVVHPAQGNLTGTVVNALLGMKKQLSETDNQFRPGIVHRLDKETSGLLIIAKNIPMHRYLSDQFKQRKIIKKYHAIVKGHLRPLKMRIENRIGRCPYNRKKMAVVTRGGKESITLIDSVKYIKTFSYLDIQLLTGRTHQIRVHLSDKGFPILGDAIYSRKNKDCPDISLCLVAYYLSFFDPHTQKMMEFTIDNPSHMQRILSENIE